MSRVTCNEEKRWSQREVGDCGGLGKEDKSWVSEELKLEKLIWESLRKEMAVEDWAGKV